MFKKHGSLIFIAFALVMGGFFYVNPRDYIVNAAVYKCDTPEEKVECTKLLNETEKEILDLSNQLSSKKNEGASLTRDKQILDIEI